MSESRVRLPAFIAIVVTVLCALPAIANLAGISFASKPVTSSVEEKRPLRPREQGEGALPAERAIEVGLNTLADRALIVHLLWQWTGVCLAMFTAASAILHFFVKRDVATPIVGSALFFCGLLEAFQLLAANDVIALVSDRTDFEPFTSAMSRLFHAAFLAIGTAIVLYVPAGWVKSRSGGGARFILLCVVLFGVAAYALIHICAATSKLPTAIYTRGPVYRPWDSLALIVFLFAGGILFPRFLEKHPSLFAHGLVISLIPNTLAQAYLSFGSTSPTDNAYAIAQYLKLLGDLVPFVGLLVDYLRASQSDVQLRATEQQLELARQIQQGLLPKAPPEIPGYDVAGASLSFEAVGGDYFDFFGLPGGAWGMVVADVSGHDLGASILMSQTRAYLRAETQHTADPGLTVTSVNRFIGHDLRDRRFVSLFLSVINPQSHELMFAAAGHTALLLRATGEVLELGPTGPLLGILDRPIAAHGPVELRPGDVLLMLTDGVLEAMNPRSEVFGQPRVVETIRSAAGTSAQMTERLLAAVKRHVAPSPLMDDFTVVVVQRTA